MDPVCGSAGTGTWRVGDKIAGRGGAGAAIKGSPRIGRSDERSGVERAIRGKAPATSQVGTLLIVPGPESRCEEEAEETVPGPGWGSRAEGIAGKRRESRQKLAKMIADNDCGSAGKWERMLASRCCKLGHPRAQLTPSLPFPRLRFRSGLRIPRRPGPSLTGS